MQFPFGNKKADVKQQRLQNNHSIQKKHDIKANSSQDITKATIISMIGYFLAKITGFLREVLVTPKLGFGMFSDPYYVAFFIPDLLYSLLIGGAVSAAITPTLSSGIERNQEKQAWHAVNIFITVSTVVMIIVLLIVGIIMPWLLPAINPGKSAEILEAAIPVSRILLIQSVFMTLISLTQGILTAYKRFGLAAFGVMIYNIVYMFVLVFLGAQSIQGLKHVAWGVVGAAVIYFIYQLILSRREIRYFKLDFNYKDPAFKQLLKLALPTLLSASVLHINSLIMNAFTYQFVGASTAIRHAEQVFMLPYGIIAVAIGTVMLPNITGFYSKRNFKRVKSLYTSSLRKSIFYIAPIAMIFFVMSFETIQLIFQWNVTTYTDEQVQIVGSVLKWFCYSLMFQTIIYMTNQAFYARKVTRISLFNGILTLILNPIFCVLYTKVFDFGIQGIAMAHASYSLVGAIIVYSLYKVHNPKAKPYRILPFMIKIIYCVIISGVVLTAINLIPLSSYNKILQILFYGIKAIIGIVVFYLAGISVNLKETREIQQKILEITGQNRREVQNAR